MHKIWTPLVLLNLVQQKAVLIYKNMNDIIRPDFLQIPVQVYSCRNLSGVDSMVYGLIYWYTKLKLEKCIASNKTFADILGVGEKKVTESIKRLVSEGFITAVYADPLKRHRQELIPLVTYKKQTHQKEVHVTPNGGSVDTPSGVHNNNILEKNKEEEVRISKSPDYLLNIPEHDIDTFRNKYKATKSEIIIKGESLFNWAGSVGRKYKDYRLFLMNALLRDYGLRELDRTGRAL